MAEFDQPTDYQPPLGETFTRETTVFVGIVVRGALDINILRQKAEELIQRWPILGRRLNRKKFPYTVPAGSELDFSARGIDESLANYFPVDFDVSKVDEDQPSFHEVDRSSDSLFHFDSMKSSSLPTTNVLAIRVTVLRDATLLGFRTPHYLCDAKSIYNIVKGYSDLISGRDILDLVLPSDTEELPPDNEKVVNDLKPAGISTGDALLFTPPTAYNLSFRSSIRWAVACLVQVISGKLRTPNCCREKYIYVSEKLISQWKSDCQREVDNHGMTETVLEDHKVPIKLSNLDVLVGWHMKSMFSNWSSESSSRPITLIYPFSIFVSKTPVATKIPSVQNAQYQLALQFPSLDAVQHLSQALFARSIRLAVLHTKQPQIVKDHYAFWRTHQQALVAYGPPGSRMQRTATVSSWAELDFSKLDFREALFRKPRSEISLENEKGAGYSEEEILDGRVLFTQPLALGPLGIVPYPLAIIVRDTRQGGYWVRAGMEPKAWKGHGYS